MNIVLTGMPASGKTTVSEILGAILKRKVVDTDALIVGEYGDISEIFKRYGEEYFRELETDAVRKAAKLENVIVSTGGGSVIRPRNVEYFKRNGKIVYLKTSIETLIERAGNDGTRPLLKGNAAENLKKLYAERTPVYEKTADMTVVTDGVSPEEVAKKIAEKFV